MKKFYITPNTEQFLVSAQNHFLEASLSTAVKHDTPAEEVSYSRTYNYNVWTDEEDKEDL